MLRGLKPEGECGESRPFETPFSGSFPASDGTPGLPGKSERAEVSGPGTVRFLEDSVRRLRLDPKPGRVLELPTPLPLETKILLNTFQKSSKLSTDNKNDNDESRHMQ